MSNDISIGEMGCSNDAEDSAHHRKKACAKVIVDVCSDRKQINLNKNILESILLRADIENKPVCVVSICGKFRQGKSFLLNHLLRHLYGEEDDEIKGFKWQYGSQRHTVGILMWSEIFTRKLPDGKEVAIVILDTQGTFDTISAIANCAAIFAISTLISSVQLYNLKEKIDMLDLQSLECFTGYGELAVNSDSQLTPFQDLYFLIRDWPYYKEKEFGFNGGKKLLEEQLDTSKDQAEETRQVKTSVKKLFQSVKCFLMPHPGQKVACEPDFQGNVSEIDGEFLKYTKQFAEYLLRDHVTVKRIGENQITVKELFYYIENYCAYFKNGNMPEIQTMFQANAEAQHQTAVIEAVKEYTKLMSVVAKEDSDLMDEREFNSQHNNSKCKALGIYRIKRKMGNKSITLHYDTLLEMELEELFLHFKNKNLDKQQMYTKWIKYIFSRNRYRIPAYGTAVTAGGAVTASALLTAATAGAVTSELIIGGAVIMTIVTATVALPITIVLVGTAFGKWYCSESKPTATSKTAPGVESIEQMTSCEEEDVTKDHETQQEDQFVSRAREVREYENPQTVTINSGSDGINQNNEERIRRNVGSAQLLEMFIKNRLLIYALLILLGGILLGKCL